MSNETKKPTVFEALQAVANDIKAIGKDRKNTQQNYSFRGIEDLYNHLHPIFAKHGVLTVPQILTREHSEGATKSGGVNYRTILEVQYLFYGPAGDSIACTVTGEGTDTGDKSCNKAMSSAHKYALTQVLAIPFVAVEDSDASSPDLTERKSDKPKAAPKSAPRLVGLPPDLSALVKDWEERLLLADTSDEVQAVQNDVLDAIKKHPPLASSRELAALRKLKEERLASISAPMGGVQ